MNVHLTQPALLALVLLVPPLMLWHLFRLSRSEGRVRFSTVGLLAQLPVTLRIRLRPLVDVLRVLALLLIVLALARPVATSTAEASASAGIDLAISIDVSGSMREQDLGPKNRLETAKDVVQEFISSRTGDRIGLVAFAGEAVAVSPLTQEYPVLLGLLGQVDFGRIDGGTAVGNGLAKAVSLVREGQGKSHVVILLTDGASTGGDISPEQAARLAESLRVRVYTIGVGSVGETSFDARRRFRDLDEPTLRRIAGATGGAYFRATDESKLKAIYRTIDEMEKTAEGTRRVVQVQDLSGFVLFAGALLLMGELLLRNTIFRRTA